MADYIEFLCICNTDKEMSMGDMLAIVYSSVESEAEREAEIEDDPTFEESPAEFKDYQQRAVEDWFEQLEYRQGAFNDFYPFQLKDRRLILETDVSDKMKCYIFLLLCSSLRIIKKSHMNTLTTLFETISTEVLKKYLPDFIVHPFGKSSVAREYYPNKLVDAIEKLAGNLGERNICQKEDIASKDTGDGGLDIVAWRPFSKDETPGKLICFAQCACSPDEWGGKIHDADIGKWRQYINFLHEPAQFIFIPICFRSSNGDWFRKSEIGSTVVIDRLRICSLLSVSDITSFDFIETVNEFLSITDPCCPN